MSQKFYSPAKINIFLHVTNRREDGFHDIASLFQTVDLCDEITVAFSDGDVFNCYGSNVPADDSNLVIKARDVFRKNTGIKTGLEINLTKKIPVMAGLGGGSGNAATTLWALNEICGKPASDSDIIKWASELGSDVAFFFSTGTAFCSGRGDIIEDLPALSAKKIWIAQPQEGLSTPEVYRNVDIADIMEKGHLNLLQEVVDGGFANISNDLEKSAVKMLPSLLDLKKQMASGGADAVFMTGSGASIVALGGHRPEVSIAGVQLFSASFINRRKEDWYYPGWLLNT